NNNIIGEAVTDSTGHAVTSIGLTVTYQVDPILQNTIDGVTSDNRVIFKLTLNPDGTFTFTLNDQIDHPVHSHDTGDTAHGGSEETLFLDLSHVIGGHDDVGNSPISAGENSFNIGVVDDTPTTADSTPDTLFTPGGESDGEGGGSFSGSFSDYTAIDD